MHQTLVCLHGWGGSGASFQELRDALNGTDITVLSPDLPGFGSEPEPPTPWSVDDYADWTEAYVKKQNVTGPIHLLGHSHGGRISIKIASRKSVPLAHLYLCAAAGMKRRRYIRRFIGMILSKAGAILSMIPFLKDAAPFARRQLSRLVGSQDYEKASPLMKQTLVLVTKENLSPLLASITAPTDLFWGTEDRYTPFADAKILEKGIQGSVLHAFPGIRHRVHRDKAADIAAVIKSHL